MAIRKDVKLVAFAFDVFVAGRWVGAISEEQPGAWSARPLSSTGDAFVCDSRDAAVAFLVQDSEVRQPSLLSVAG